MYLQALCLEFEASQSTRKAKRSRRYTYSVDVCGGCGVIEESSPLRGKVRLTVNTRFREPARRSYRTIDRVGPSVRDVLTGLRVAV